MSAYLSAAGMAGRMSDMLAGAAGGPAFALALVAGITAALAQPCGAYETVARNLSEQHGERLMARGIDGEAPDMVELWADPEGDGWTLITAHYQQGRMIACALRHGWGGWHEMDEEPPNPQEETY